MNFFKDRIFIRFVIKFLLVFCICYYGTLAIIGLSAPGGYYSAFVDKYLDYVSWLRSGLLHGSAFLLSLFGADTYKASEYTLQMVNGRGINIVYECIGYGIMSFWIAFVNASAGSYKKKLFWLITGLTFFFILNITRLSLVLVAINKNWPMPLGWNHHTWFNIVAYMVIFLLMFLYNRHAEVRGEPENKNKYER
jgi:exosortase/archaeosortase family protein